MLWREVSLAVVAAVDVRLRWNHLQIVSFRSSQVMRWNVSSVWERTSRSTSVRWKGAALLTMSAAAGTLLRSSTATEAIVGVLEVEGP